RAFGQADYSDDDIHVVPQQFPVGKQHLDGYQAVAYGRIRQGSSDLDRILRQQRVAAALIADATSPSSLFRIPAVWRAYRQAIGTDMSMRQSAGVLAMLKRVPAADLKTASLGDAAVPCNSCVGALLLLVPSKVQQIVADAFGDPAAGQRAAELLVAAHVAG
ncbi:MAG: LCP family protein, partial [Dehalococcoidia bacterium]